MSSIKRLMFEVGQFFQISKTNIQYHDSGGHLKTFHWSDPKDPENHYNMNRITDNYFTPAEAEKALKLVNAVLKVVLK